jgi:hypothetical protein
MARWSSRTLGINVVRAASLFCSRMMFILKSTEQKCILRVIIGKFGKFGHDA